MKSGISILLLLAFLSGLPAGDSAYQDTAGRYIWEGGYDGPEFSGFRTPGLFLSEDGFWDICFNAFMAFVPNGSYLVVDDALLCREGLTLALSFTITDRRRLADLQGGKLGASGPAEGRAGP